MPRHERPAQGLGVHRGEDAPDQGRQGPLHALPGLVQPRAPFLRLNVFFPPSQPADISGVSCKEGEVAASVFERYRIPTYKEASHKPYVIAAMVLTSKFHDIAGLMQHIIDRNQPRVEQF